MKFKVQLKVKDTYITGYIDGGYDDLETTLNYKAKNSSFLKIYDEDKELSATGSKEVYVYIQNIDWFKLIQGE